DRLDDREAPGAARRRDDGAAIDPDPSDEPAVVDGEPVQVALLVSERHRIADERGRAEQPSGQAFLHPDRLPDVADGVDPPPRVDGNQTAAVEIDRTDRRDVPVPEWPPRARVDASDPPLVAAGAELAADQHGLAQHVGDALDLVGAAR